MKQIFEYRSVQPIAKVALILIVAVPLLAACSFGAAQEEGEPVQLQEYQASTTDEPQSEADSAATDAARDSQVASNDEAAAVEPEAAAASADTSAAANTTAAESAAAPADENSESTTERAENPAPIVVRGDYNGEVGAQSSVAVMAEASGMALAVNVEVGDKVEMGQPLVQVDSAMLEAQVAQAIARLEGAQAQLDQILLDTDPEDLEAAQAAVNAAAANYSDAAAGADEEDRIIAETQLRTAEAAVRRAQNAYNDVKWNPKIGMLPQSLQLEQATLQLEAAKAQYQKVLNGAGDNVIAGAYAQLVQARTQLENLTAGPKDEQIRAVEAQVEQAEVALYMTQLQLEKATVKAPMSGVVTQVNVTRGGMVAPGSPLLMIMSDDVEITIPVEELRLPELAVGQKATIRANAYPDRVFNGEVTAIAPQLDPQTRTVQVTIRPTEAADELIPGMFAAVDLVE